MSVPGRRNFGQSDSFDDATEEQKDQGERPNKFLYTGKKQKLDPWGQDDPTAFFEIKSKLSKSSSTSPTEFDLDDVWSIRRNVQVSQNVRKGPSTNTSTGKTSFYSRHGGFIGNGDGENNSLNAKRAKLDRRTGNDASEHKSWSTQQSRPHYSYSDQQGNSAESDKEFDFDPLMNSSSPNTSFVNTKNKLNSHHGVPGASQPPVREMSARTQRAHKMQQAHNKSMGLGQFAPGQNPYFRQVDDNESKVKWKLQDDEF